MTSLLGLNTYLPCQHRCESQPQSQASTYLNTLHLSSRLTSYRQLQESQAHSIIQTKSFLFSLAFTWVEMASEVTMIEPIIESVKPQETRAEFVPIAMEQDTKPNSNRYVVCLFLFLIVEASWSSSFFPGQSHSSMPSCCGGNTCFIRVT